MMKSRMKPSLYAAEIERILHLQLGIERKNKLSKQRLEQLIASEGDDHW
jgi:hypothetical protein